MNGQFLDSNHSYPFSPWTCLWLPLLFDRWDLSIPKVCIYFKSFNCTILSSFLSSTSATSSDSPLFWISAIKALSFSFCGPSTSSLMPTHGFSFFFFLLPLLRHLSPDFVPWFLIFIILILFIFFHYLFILTNVPLVVLRCDMYGLIQCLMTFFLLWIFFAWGVTIFQSLTYGGTHFPRMAEPFIGSSGLIRGHREMLTDCSLLPGKVALYLF